MKRLIITTVLVWLTGFFTAFGQWEKGDEGLLEEIKTWKKGKAPPERLLSFPDDWGYHDVRWGFVWVYEYFPQIKDSDLLAEIIFHPRAKLECVFEAAKIFVRLEGVNGLARLVAEQHTRKDAVALIEPPEILVLDGETNVLSACRVSSIFERPILATLTQLVHLPYITVKGASITKKDMETKKAKSILRKMGTELAAGRKWKDVYEEFSDANPDMRDRAKNPNSVRTLVGYCCDCVVSPCGFDISEFAIVQDIDFPRTHLKELFRAKKGHHIIETSDAVYLYYIEAYFDGSANKASEAIAPQGGAQHQR